MVTQLLEQQLYRLYLDQCSPGHHLLLKALGGSAQNRGCDAALDMQPGGREPAAPDPSTLLSVTAHTLSPTSVTVKHVALGQLSLQTPPQEGRAPAPPARAASPTGSHCRQPISVNSHILHTCVLLSNT